VNAGPGRGHVPVLVEEVFSFLAPAPGDVIVDATFGAGGHSRYLLENAPGPVRIIGMDKDGESLKAAGREFEGCPDIRLFHADFKEFAAVMEHAGIQKIQGCIFDLGVSSLQLEDAGRGFSFMKDGPLDMRMDRRSSLTAEEVVNEYPVEELERIFAEFAGERHPRRVAETIARERRRERITTTSRLMDVLRKAGVSRRGTRWPEAPFFTAIRMEVNGEAESLRRGLEQAVSFLDRGARMCVISFHSGEDRIVKRVLRGLEDEGVVRNLVRPPVTPTRAERRRNPRSRSAKMRVVERKG